MSSNSDARTCEVHRLQPGRIDDDGFDMMWRFLMVGGQRANYPALKDACMQLQTMLTQMTGGQKKYRKARDVPFTEFEAVIKAIVIEAMALVLSGEYE